MNKLKLGVLLVVCLLAISGVAMAQGEKGDENANSILSPEQKQAKSLNEEFAPDEIIVKFKEGTSDATISMINSKNKVVSSEKIITKNPKAVENEKTKILKKHGLDRIHILKLQKNSDVNKMVSKYNEDPDVEYAEPNYKVYVNAITIDDTYFYLLWGMHNTGYSGGTVDADIDAPEAWDITTGSSDIVVAVIDTGVDYTHPDLDANMWTNPDEIPGDGIDNDNNGYVDDIRGWDFFSNDNNPYDESGHGTHCSGTIAAEGNNGEGVVGVSWNAKIMPLRFLGPEGGYTSDAILAIEYAINEGAHIMSNSWGGGGYSVALKDAISAANDAEIIFVAAAGNSRKNTDRRPHYPSSYDVPNIISVAATDRYDNLASFSNYGLNSVDLAAPGVDILSTYPNGYAWGDGTSMAAPHVAGAAALIMAQNPTISAANLKAKILDSVDPISALNGITVTGGRLNVYNALEDLNTPPTADANGPYTGTEDIGVTFDGSGSYDLDGDEITYHWDFGDSSTGSGVSAIHTYTTSGEYTVTLTVNDGEADSEPSTTIAKITEVNNPPIAYANGPYTGTEDIDVTFYGSESYDPDGDTLTYHWDFGDDSTGTGEYPTHIYTAGGEYTVTLTVNDGKANSLPYTTTATITEVNDAPVADAGSDQAASVDDEVTFDGSGSYDIDGTIQSYDWNFGDGSTGTGISSTNTYATTGTYTVTLTVTDDDGLTDTDELIVTVTDEPTNTMHIASIDMSLKRAGPNRNGIALVTVVDATGATVAGATVSGTWSGLTSDTDSGLTDANGHISLSSDKVRNAPIGEIFTFTVDDIALSEWTYDSGANVETSDSITIE